MNRRKFFRSLGIGVGVACVAPSLLHKINPTGKTLFIKKYPDIFDNDDLFVTKKVQWDGETYYITELKAFANPCGILEQEDLKLGFMLPKKFRS